MTDLTKIIVTGIFSAAASAALVTAIKELVLWKLNRKACKSDKQDSRDENISNIQKSIIESNHEHDIDMQKLSSILEKLENTLDIAIDSNKLLLQDRIYFIASSYLKNKNISYENRKRIHDMWEIYHNRMHCNGDLDPIMRQIDNMPLDITFEDTMNQKLN